MIVLSGAELVLPDRILAPGTIAIDGDRIVDIRPGAIQGAQGFAFHGHYIVPGFIDVHVHGADGIDTLDPGDAVAALSARLPRHGVTAFCPTTVACSPGALRRVLSGVRQAREVPRPRSARVLPAHLESNFLNPDYAGAQPASCLRHASGALRDRAARIGASNGAGAKGEVAVSARDGGDFDGADILDEIERALPDVAVVTLAPELDGGLDLIAWLVSRGPRVSLGHSAATYDDGLAAIGAGARQATHLFNRMAPLGHRAPGLAGAVLQAGEVAAELICDGFHVHPALVRVVVAAKHPSRVLAISDGTAVAGLPTGSRGALGGRPIRAGESTALLEDGTPGGSVMSMDGVFRTLVERVDCSLVDAATMCSTTPAREMGLVGHGLLAVDAVADLVVLDARLSVVQTYIGGRLAYSRSADGRA